MTESWWICATAEDGTKYYGQRFMRSGNDAYRIRWHNDDPPSFTPLISVRVLSPLEVLALMAE